MYTQGLDQKDKRATKRDTLETPEQLEQAVVAAYQAKDYGKAIELKIEDTLGLEVEYRQKWTDEAKSRLDRIPSFARGMVVQGIEKFATERGVALIDEQVVQKSREEMITKRGAMFPFLKKFINSEKLDA